MKARAGASRQACEPINNLWFISARCTGAHWAEEGAEGRPVKLARILARICARSAEMTRAHISSRDANNDVHDEAKRRFSNEKIEFFGSRKRDVYPP